MYQLVPRRCFDFIDVSHVTGYSSRRKSICASDNPYLQVDSVFHRFISDPQSEHVEWSILSAREKVIFIGSMV